MLTSLRVKNSRRLSHRRVSRILWNLFPGAQPGSHCNYQRKTPQTSGFQDQGTGIFWNMPEHCVLNKACPQENWLTRTNLLEYFQSLTDLGRTRKEKLEEKTKQNTETGMKNTFDRFISTLDTDEERMSELENKKKRGQRLRKSEQIIHRLWGKYKWSNLCTVHLPEEEERNRRNVWNNNNWEVLQIKFRH